MNKVFGIGLQRTGTTSLYVALHHLGIHILHYPHDEITYNQLIRGDYRLKVVEECDGACDLSVATYYEGLDRAFPGSKFILTVREMDSWLRSVHYHWLGNYRDYYPEMKHRSKFALFISATTYGCLYYERERFRYVYNKHISDVKEYFKDRPDDLLILDICGGEGWEKLCKFFDKPVPDTKFPDRNKADYSQHLLI